MTRFWFLWALGATLLLPCVAKGANHSIARTWDEEILTAIRIDLPHPPVHARNLFHLSAAMYDAWAAYDSNAVGWIYRGKHTATNVALARREAISFAAYRMLQERYAFSRGAAVTLPALDARIAALGYDKSNRSFDASTPAGLGNLIAAAISAYAIEDGALQTRSFQDYPPNQGGYASVNLPLLISVPGTLADNVNRWQPLAITDATTQNGIPADSIQKFLGAQWLGARPFCLKRDDPTLPWINPGPPPFLGQASDTAFRENVVAVIQRSSELTVDDGVTMDISPGAFGNSSLGANDGTGHPMNPATNAKYAPNVVKRGDFARVLAEFWADGPSSETPPGHWNSLANYVADDPTTVKRIGGTGPVVDPLEWDVKVYFAMNGALHDAACAAWSLKRYYDGWRPITGIRYMGQLGQSTDPNLNSYHRFGLPLIPGLIEVVTATTAATNGRHANLPVDRVVIKAWPGQPANPKSEVSGTRWILASAWFPFQKKTFITPAFPGYVSGHSTFSRAAAEVLTSFTGSAYFPGGLGTYNASAGTFLTFELGPSQDIQLQWATYYDAADQAGLSRIWGGIHPPVDDLTGRIVGSQVGKSAWALARQYFDGSVAQGQPQVAIKAIAPGAQSQSQLRWETLRGFYYSLQSSTNLQNWRNESTGFTRALNSSETRLDATADKRKFFRVLFSPTGN